MYTCPNGAHKVPAERGDQDAAACECWATSCALPARGGLKKELFRLWKMRPWEALHDVNSIAMGGLVRGGRFGTLGMSYKMHGTLYYLMFVVPKCKMKAIFDVTTFCCKHWLKPHM
jgi:hypothetical protein